MKTGLITAALSLGMLYAQAASAGEMVRYDHAIFVADASTVNSSVKAKSTKQSRKIHRHRHHHHHHHKHYRQDCGRYSHSHCADGMVNQAVMEEPMTVEQVEPHMDILNRNHGTRGGRGR